MSAHGIMSYDCLLNVTMKVADSQAIVPVQLVFQSMVFLADPVERLAAVIERGFCVSTCSTTDRISRQVQGHLPRDLTRELTRS